MPKLLLLSLWLCAFLPPSTQASMLLKGFMVNPDDVLRLRIDPIAMNDLIAHPGPDDLDMQKSWHGVHYLLTGDAWSTSGKYGKAVMGGEEIGADLGYGPAHVLTAPEVREIAAALRDLPIDALRARYDTAAMTKAKIYPMGDWSRAAPGDEDWLLAEYQKLVAFYEAAAARGKAVILAMQ